MEILNFVLATLALVISGTSFIGSISMEDGGTSKEVIETCPKCSTSIIESYTLIMPRNKKCPYCGTKMRCYKA